MKSIDGVIADLVNKGDAEIEIVNHRMRVLKDAEYLVDLIKRTRPPKAPEFYDVHDSRGRFQYRAIVEYRIKEVK